MIVVQVPNKWNDTGQTIIWVISLRSSDYSSKNKDCKDELIGIIKGNKTTLKGRQESPNGKGDVGNCINSLDRTEIYYQGCKTGRDSRPRHTEF